MHLNSFNLMGALLTEFADPLAKKWKRPLRVLDIGSMDVNGNYRKLIESRKWQYVGIDIAQGKNVDVVAENEYDFTAARESLNSTFPASFDLVISGQCAEHVRKPWKWMWAFSEMVGDSGGMGIIIAPWCWEEHRHPLDCFRYLPDGMESLMEEGGLKVLKTGKSEYDCYGVGVKE